MHAQCGVYTKGRANTVSHVSLCDYSSHLNKFFPIPPCRSRVLCRALCLTKKGCLKPRQSRGADPRCGHAEGCPGRAGGPDGRRSDA
eukprot:2856375-Prymnesium_polylepis.4